MSQVLEDRKPVSESNRNPLPLDAAKIAIAERFVDVAGHMDIHLLWTNACGAFFRVNWWGFFLKGTVETGRICRSAFVRIFHDGTKLQVEDRTKVTESGTWPRDAVATQAGALREAGTTSEPATGL